MIPSAAGTDTDFAPAFRLDNSHIRDQFQELVSEGRIPEMLNAAPYISMVTNSTRQIVFGNLELENFMRMPAEEFIGKRPGELLGCVNAHDNPGGCGTGKNCRFCGIVRTLLDAMKKGERIVNEARMFLQRENKTVAYDLKVTAAPMFIGTELFLLVFLEDISSRKKKEHLERTFFHDVMNTASGLKNLAMYLAETEGGDIRHAAGLLVDQSNLLIEEIRSQRQLIDAESDNLAVNPVLMETLVLFTEIRTAAEAYKAAEGKKILSTPETPSISVLLDPVLVKRVVLNMLKNALEATDEGGEIRFAMTYESGDVVFKVWNPAVMPESVRSQVFQRSFSTRGPGRGIGAYSMKLITEQYLNGTVSFYSEEGAGTEFMARFPGNPGSH